MEATATKNRETRQHDGQSRPSYSGFSGKAGESGAKPEGIAYPERPVSETKNGLTPESRESGFLYGNRDCLQPVRTKNYRKPYFENGTAIEHNRNDAETVPDIRQKNGDNKEECMEYYIILTI